MNLITILITDGGLIFILSIVFAESFEGTPSIRWCQLAYLTFNRALEKQLTLFFIVRQFSKGRVSGHFRNFTCTGRCKNFVRDVGVFGLFNFLHQTLIVTSYYTVYRVFRTRIEFLDTVKLSIASIYEVIQADPKVQV